MLQISDYQLQKREEGEDKEYDGQDHNLFIKDHAVLVYRRNKYQFFVYFLRMFHEIFQQVGPLRVNITHCTVIHQNQDSSEQLHLNIFLLGQKIVACILLTNLKYYSLILRFFVDRFIRYVLVMYPCLCLIRFLPCVCPLAIRYMSVLFYQYTKALRSDKKFCQQKTFVSSVHRPGGKYKVRPQLKHIYLHFIIYTVKFYVYPFLMIHRYMK